MEKAELTSRQRNILIFSIQEYIATGQAVSSLCLARKYKLPVSSATIRNDFFALTKKGYLYKEYSSSGRIPTDKAWKWFVQTILQKGEYLSHLSLALDKIFAHYQRIIKQENYLFVIKHLLDELVEKNHFFGFCYMGQEDRVYENGLEYVFRDLAREGIMSLEEIQPLVQSVDELDQRLKNVRIPPQLSVFIGKENPLISSNDFSTIIASLPIHSIIVGVIGTKRMPYDKHIALLQRITHMFSDDNVN